MDAARALVLKQGDASFTVSQVVARAGSSLKSFYRHFEGRDALVLALLKEECRRGAAVLHAAMDDTPDEVERIGTYVRGLFSLVGVGGGYAQLLAREHLRLGYVHPVELRNALAPLLDLLVGEIDAAMTSGAVRAGARVGTLWWCSASCSPTSTLLRWASSAGTRTPRAPICGTSAAPRSSARPPDPLPLVAVIR